MMRIFPFALFVTIVPVVAAQMQDVSLCQLEQDARDFDHKLVRVRSVATLEFEDFGLDDSRCAGQKSPTPVWLTFGGDVSDIATYCCGDHSRKPGDNLRIDGREVPISKDSNFRRFVTLLQASRNRMPNGERCFEGCKFYRVTATLEGLFLAKPANAGYGHLGCCSQLIIQRVTDVAPERTPVPAGGRFQCNTQVWKPQPSEVEPLSIAQDCRPNCDDLRRSVVSTAASHWQQSVNAADGYMLQLGNSSEAPPSETLTWVSADKITQIAVRQETTSPLNMSVSRQACVPVEPPFPAATPITCDERHLSPDWSDETQKHFEELLEKDYPAAELLTVRAAEKLSADGDQSWRTKDAETAGMFILRRETKKWGISLDRLLRAEKCSAPDSLDEQSYAYVGCEWYSPDGMQEFSLNFIKRKTRPGPETIRDRWLLNGVTARVCRADSASVTASR